MNCIKRFFCSYNELGSYSLLAVIIFVADRITKYYALHHFVDRIQLNSMFSFELVFNRGVSFGMLYSDNQTLYMILTCAIGAVVGFLSMFMYHRWQAGTCVLGEVLVLVGAASNLIDRVIYNGVIDFIQVWFGSWMFPVFNIADMAIVLGVAIMFAVNVRE